MRIALRRRLPSPARTLAVLGPVDIPAREPQIALERGVARDSRHMGGTAVARNLYINRYLRGQALYQMQASPINSADIVVDNTDFKSPNVTQTPSGTADRGAPRAGH